LQIENAKKLLNHPNLHFVETYTDALKDADACILVTEWKEYIDIPAHDFLRLMKKAVIIDGRRVYNYKKFREKGIVYKGIGLGK